MRLVFFQKALLVQKQHAHCPLRKPKEFRPPYHQIYSREHEVCKLFRLKNECQNIFWPKETGPKFLRVFRPLEGLLVQQQEQQRLYQILSWKAQDQSCRVETLFKKPLCIDVIAFCRMVNNKKNDIINLQPNQENIVSSPQSILEKSQVILSSGPRPYESRSVSKLAVSALVLSMALFAGGVQAGQPSPQYSGYTTASQQNVNRIPAQVVNVKHLKDGDYSREDREIDRDRSHTDNKTRNQVERIIGGLIGGLAGQKLGGNSNVGRGIGAIAGALTGLKIAEWQKNRRARQQNQNDPMQEANVRMINDRILVTVDVNLNGSYQRYEIEESAALPVRNGDTVFLEPNENGGITIVPEVKLTSKNRPR